MGQFGYFYRNMLPNLGGGSTGQRPLCRAKKAPRDSSETADASGSGTEERAPTYQPVPNMGKLLILPMAVSKRCRAINEDTGEGVGACDGHEHEHAEGGKKQRCIEDCEDTIPQMKRHDSCFSVASFGQGNRPPSAAASADSRSSSHVSTASSGASSFSVSFAISRRK